MQRDGRDGHGNPELLFSFANMLAISIEFLSFCHVGVW